MKKLVLSAVLLLAVPTMALAVTATGFPGDEVVAAGYNSFMKVWLPVIAMAAIVGMALALWAGFKVGQKTVALVFILALLGGGLGLASRLSGGTIAEAATLDQPCCQRE